jgi:hypothetical protein
VNIEKTYASLTIKNEITYGNLFEFFNNYDDIIFFYNYIKNNHNIKFYQNYLEYNINIFINVFKQSFNIKNQQGPMRIVQIQELIVSKQVEVYLAFEKMIVNIINLLENYETDLINKTKLKNILDELSKIDIKPKLYFFGGGNLNEELKINFLNTGKYKELQKNNETIPSELEEYKNKYQNNDEYDDMNKIGQLSDDIDKYYNSTKNKKIKDKFIIQQINKFENDPKNPLDELEITFDDRLVFIIATFFIRYITIIMVQWCIDINIIKNFYEGFIYYAIIYIIIFWFIVLFINIDNSFDVKYMNFNGIINTIRTLFYYFYMGTNGISRLLIHTSLIILLIIIPIILNIKNNTVFKEENEDEDVKILNYDERKQLSKSLSLFTMFIWLFTSIIATKF